MRQTKSQGAKMKALALIMLSGCTAALGTSTTGRPGPAPAAEGSAPDSTRAPEAASESSAGSGATAGEIAERVDVPGGRLTRDARTCDVAADHCLRPETWFLVKRLDKMESLEPVFWADGAWRRWSSGGVIEGGPAHRTRAATLEDLAVGAPVIFRANGKYATNEAEAHNYWALETIHSIDAADGTFEWGRGSRPIPFELARVIVETRE